MPSSIVKIDTETQQDGLKGCRYKETDPSGDACIRATGDAVHDDIGAWGLNKERGDAQAANSSNFPCFVKLWKILAEREGSIEIAKGPGPALYVQRVISVNE